MSSEGEIGPGFYNPQPVYPRTQSPDLQRSIGRPDLVDDNVGPAHYSPIKENVLYESPKWTIGERRDQSPPSEDNLGYYDDKGFGANAKTFTIVAPKDQSPARSTAGPGEYDWEKGVQASKPRAQSVLINPESQLKASEIQRQSQGGGPGSYSPEKPFGADAKVVKIDPVAREKSLEESPGPGMYDAERADVLTRARSAAVIINPNGHSRAQTLIQSSLGPGTYDPVTKFGEDAKTFTIPEIRPDKKVTSSLGPGTYDPTAAESLTRSRSPTTKFSKWESRPELFATKVSQDNVGPGTYDDGKQFGQDVKPIKFSQAQPVKQKTTENGPGSYNPEKASALTKPRPKSAFIAKEKRKTDVTLTQEGADPGKYNASKPFGSDVKPLTIGTRRNAPTRHSRVGPGLYNPERGLQMIKPKSPMTKISQGVNQRPKTFALQNAESTVDPGKYNVQKQFASDAKPIHMGVKRPEKLRDSVGPGIYNPERADEMVRQRSPTTKIGLSKSPSRPQSLALLGQIGTAGPGQYSSPRKFGDDAKTFTIAERRPQKSNEGVGPGQYSPEQAEILTKPKTKIVVFNKQKSRPQSFANLAQIDGVSPGQYDDGRDFLTDAKGFKIGEKRPEKLSDNIGPGHYSPERAESVTKPHAPSVKITNASPSRPQSLAIQAQVGTSGSSTVYPKFGDDAKTFTIGEKRPEKTNEGIGPGQYSPERAEKLTQPKVKIVVFSKQPNRPQSFANLAQIGGVSPGQYDDGRDFLTDAKSFAIGQKRPEKLNDNVGPGHYSPERAESQTKPRIVSINLGSNSPNRPSSFALAAQIETAGPGQYNSPKKFGDDVRGFTIGEKRPEKLSDNIGPGHYSPERAESVTKPHAPAVKITNASPSRPQSLAIQAQVGTSGSSTVYPKFGDDAKTFTIGEKRPEKFNDNVGPGHYNPERAESVTKPHYPEVKITNGSPSRPNSFAIQAQVGTSGSSQTYPKFGDDVKGFTIGEKRPEKLNDNIGPGHYSPERAESVTKPHAPAVKITTGSPSRPQSFANQAQVGTLGSSTVYPKFGEDAKTFTIGEKRPEKFNDNVGPGHYNPERAESVTKPHYPEVKITNGSPSRPNSFAIQAQVGTSGSSQTYPKFGDDVKGFTIGEKRPEKLNDNIGPGHYSPERAESVTKPHSPSVKITTGSPSRPNSFAIQAEIGTTGSSTVYPKFGDDAKTFTIGVKFPQRTSQSPGPGTYTPERAENITKSKQAIIFSKNPSRPETSTNEVARLGPGQYDMNVAQPKGGKISDKPRFEKIKSETPGPGAYQEVVAPKKTFSAVKKQRSGRFEAQRRQSKVLDPIGPGYYNANPSATRPKTQIAVFRKPRTEKKANGQDLNIGPGYYNTSKAVNLVKPKAQAAKISPVKDRPAKQRDNGEQELQYSFKVFGYDAKTFTIGAKREERVERSPGPGDYNHERSDSVTKTRAPAVDFTKNPERDSPSNDRQSPEFYEVERFYNYPKEIPNFTMGQKREEKQDEKPGPGEYDVNSALTKPRIMGSHKFSPTRETLKTGFAPKKARPSTASKK